MGGLVSRRKKLASSPPFLRPCPEERLVWKQLTSCGRWRREDEASSAALNLLIKADVFIKRRYLET